LTISPEKVTWSYLGKQINWLETLTVFTCTWNTQVKPVVVMMIEKYIVLLLCAPKCGYEGVSMHQFPNNSKQKHLRIICFYLFYKCIEFLRHAKLNAYNNLLYLNANDFIKSVFVYDFNKMLVCIKIRSYFKYLSFKFQVWTTLL
jgi:hypothetical protein